MTWTHEYSSLRSTFLILCSFHFLFYIKKESSTIFCLIFPKEQVKLLLLKYVPIQYACSTLEIDSSREKEKQRAKEREKKGEKEKDREGQHITLLQLSQKKRGPEKISYFVFSDPSFSSKRFLVSRCDYRHTFVGR